MSIINTTQLAFGPDDRIEVVQGVGPYSDGIGLKVSRGEEIRRYEMTAPEALELAQLLTAGAEQVTARVKAIDEAWQRGHDEALAAGAQEEDADKAGDQAVAAL